MKKLLLVILGILILVFIFLFWGGAQFTQMSINQTVSKMRDSIDFSNIERFSKNKLDKMPELMQKYFSSVIKGDSKLPKFITVEQTADFKTDIESDWMPLTATQYFTTEKPNFLWYSEMTTSKLFWVNAIDSYINHKGNMLIKLNSSITIADSWGIELDKSGLFRYISEAVLFPTALLPSDNLLWNVLDSNTAEIKFTDGENSIVAKLFFNDSFHIYKIETYDKYRALGEGYEKSLYTIYLSDYKYFNSTFLVPSFVEVEWDLPTGKFKYGKFNISSVKYE